MLNKTPKKIIYLPNKIIFITHLNELYEYDVGDELIADVYKLETLILGDIEMTADGPMVVEIDYEPDKFIINKRILSKNN